MSLFFFSLSDGKRTICDREGVDLGGLSDVQREALDFGREVLKHRFAYGIDDPAEWTVRVSNEIGRVLTHIPLSRFRRTHHAA
jgi:hypothetical protein